MPLGFDLPFEKLLNYQGRNPKPADFDEFWDKGLAEIKKMDPQVELKPVLFQTPFAECFDLYFTGTGGARVYAKLYKPKNAKPKHPAVLCFHGYSGSSGDWTSHLSYAAAGYTVAALDCRGQAGLSEDTGGVIGGTLRGHIVRGLKGPAENLYFRHVFLDTAMLARIIMEMPDVDPSRVGAIGGSQGGGLTLACAALVPTIKWAGPTFPFLCDYKRVWEMDQAKDAYWELQDYFKKYDPLHKTEEATFLKLGYIDVQHLAPRIKAEVMMGVGLMDTVCPPSTQFSAYNKISSKKSYVLYPDFGHEGLPGFSDSVYQYMMGL